MRFRLIALLVCTALALSVLAACDSGGQASMQQQIDSKNAEIAALRAEIESVELSLDPLSGPPGGGLGPVDLQLDSRSACLTA